MTKKFLIRFIIGFSIGELIGILLSAGYVSVLTGVCVAVIFGVSVVYDIEDIGLITATTTHYWASFIALVIASFCLHLVEKSEGLSVKLCINENLTKSNFKILTVFVIIYVLVCVIQTIWLRKKVGDLNAKLKSFK